jgi:hypothetical protein
MDQVEHDNQGYGKCNLYWSKKWVSKTCVRLEEPEDENKN